MAFQVGRKILEGYVLTGKVYGVEQNSQVVYREEHIPLNNGKYLARSTENKTSWWIKRDDGTEKRLIVNEDIPLRDGHEVSAIYVGWREAESMWPIAVFNATTKQLFRYPTQVIAKRVSFGDAFRGGCLVPILGFLAVPVMSIIGATMFKMGWTGFGVGLGIFIATFVFAARRTSRRMGQFEKDLQTHIQTGLGWERPDPPGVSVRVWTE